MSDKKRVFWTFQVSEAGAFARYLEEMAEKGWYLEQAGRYGLRFYRDEPSRRRYAAGLLPGSVSVSGADSWAIRELTKQCLEAGWELQCSGPVWQIYYTENSELPLPEDLRPEKQVQVQKECMFTVSSILLAVLLTGLTVLSCGRLLKHPGEAFAVPGMVSLHLLMVGAVAFYVLDLIWHGFWFRKVGKRIREQGTAPELSLSFVKRKRWLMCGLLLAGLAMCVADFALQDSGQRGGAIVRWLIAYGVTLGVCALVLKCVRRHSSGSRKADFGIYFAGALILGGLTMFLLTNGLEHMFGDRRDLSAYERKGEFPVEFSDLGYEPSDHWYRRSDRSVLAFYQRETGRNPKNGYRMTMEYYESPIPWVIERTREQYPNDIGGNVWTVSFENIPQQYEEIMVTRCFYQLSDPEAKEWDVLTDEFDVYMISDRNRLLVLNYDCVAEAESVDRAVELFAEAS